MDIYLPEIKREYPWFKKLGIALFNWIAWFIPALADTLSEETDPDSETVSEILVILAMVFAFVLPILVVAIGTFVWWHIALYALGAYLFFGALFHLDEWHKK